MLVNPLRPRQNGRHFADDIFKRIFLNENIWISLKISLKFVPKVPINNIPALVQIMAWRRPGAKPLSEPMMVNSLTHICVARPQWVKGAPGVYTGTKLTFDEPGEREVNDGHFDAPTFHFDVLAVQTVVQWVLIGALDEHIAPVHVSVLELERLLGDGQGKCHLVEDTVGLLHRLQLGTNGWY